VEIIGWRIIGVNGVIRDAGSSRVQDLVRDHRMRTIKTICGSGSTGEIVSGIICDAGSSIQDHLDGIS
jgi:hypothetical protein